MNLATFLLILAILGIIIGVLNKGARVIALFVAMMAIVLLIGTPGNRNSNFFANLLNGNQAAQTPATQSPNATQPFYDPNTGAVINSPNATGNGNPGTNSNASSPAQGSGGDLSSQPFTGSQSQAQAPQPAQSNPPAGQVPPTNNSVITNNTGSRTPSPYVPPRRALW